MNLLLLALTLAFLDLPALRGFELVGILVMTAGVVGGVKVAYALAIARAQVLPGSGPGWVRKAGGAVCIGAGGVLIAKP